MSTLKRHPALQVSTFQKQGESASRPRKTADEILNQRCPATTGDPRRRQIDQTGVLLRHPPPIVCWHGVTYQTLSISRPRCSPPWRLGGPWAEWSGGNGSTVVVVIFCLLPALLRLVGPDDHRERSRAERVWKTAPARLPWVSCGWTLESMAAHGGTKVWRRRAFGTRKSRKKLLS